MVKGCLHGFICRFNNLVKDMRLTWLNLVMDYLDLILFPYELCSLMLFFFPGL